MVAISTDLELIQFPFSTYNEKVRWALDYKGLGRKDTPLLPGPHVGYVRKRTGQTATPVLRSEDRYISGSAAILAYLEELRPDPPLFPADPAARESALDIQRRFDEDWGPRSRRAILSVIAAHPGYLSRMFGSGHSPLKRMAYAATLPLVRGKIRRGNGIHGPGDIADGERAIDEMLDFIADATRATGYLVGDRFTLADLTAASFIAPVADPPGSTMARPRPVPKAIREWQARRAGHPGVAWTLGIYRQHRRMSGARVAA